VYRIKDTKLETHLSLHKLLSDGLIVLNIHKKMIINL
ncbi:hypothetical protein THOM_1814, partial [Trachipleistophora hominis]